MAPLELINVYLAGRVVRASGDGHRGIQAAPVLFGRGDRTGHLLSIACVSGQHPHGAGITRDGSRLGRHTIQLIAAAELVGQRRVVCAAVDGQDSPALCRKTADGRRTDAAGRPGDQRDACHPAAPGQP